MESSGLLDRLHRTAIHAVVVLMLVSFGFASSSSWQFLIYGRRWRFRLLVVLTVLSVVYLLRRRPRRTPARAVYLAAAGLVGLAYTSALWSVDTRLTLERAGALSLLVVSAGALAASAAGRPEVAIGLLRALLAAAVIVALIGVYFLVFHPDLAIQSATLQYPARYQGMGQNPNTVAMLLALAMPLALYFTTDAQRRLVRASAAAAVLLLGASIVASGSRGGFLAAFVGSLLWLLVLDAGRRRRVALAAAAVAVFVASAAIMQIPKPNQPARTAPATPQRPTAVPRDAELTLPLEEEIGAPGRSKAAPIRTLFGTGDRARAWSGALRQAARRPVAGYGFGTESLAFVDRYYAFYGTLAENSYIGTFIQLGAAGLAALLAFVLAVGVSARRAIATSSGVGRALPATCAAVVVGGLALGVTQSYLTSVGNVATTSVWISGFLLAALAADGRRVGADQRGEREEEAPPRHRITRLEVVDGVHEREGEQEETESPRGASARDGPEHLERRHEQRGPVGGPEQR
jgi:hypothetical protein